MRTLRLQRLNVRALVLTQLGAETELNIAHDACSKRVARLLVIATCDNT